MFAVSLNLPPSAKKNFGKLSPKRQHVILGEVWYIGCSHPTAEDPCAAGVATAPSTTEGWLRCSSRDNNYDTHVYINISVYTIGDSLPRNYSTPLNKFDMDGIDTWSNIKIDFTQPAAKKCYYALHSESLDFQNRSNPNPGTWFALSSRMHFSSMISPNLTECPQKNIEPCVFDSF